MKSLKSLSLTILVLLLFVNTNFSQTINWKALDKTKQIISSNFGLDYSVFFALGYSYKLKTKLPMILNVSFSKPSGKELLDDFKSKIGGQIEWFNKSNFVGSVGVYGIRRRYETKYIRLQNFGSEIKGTFGYYKPKWFFAADVGFDKAIVTHFKHSKEFKEEIFENVTDGWYVPSTGGNFSYGFLTGFTLNKADLTLNAGKVISQDFRTAPVLPIYLILGFNYKFK